MRTLKLIAIMASVAFTATMACAESYSFKLNNKTHNTMVKLLVSEDGKAWGYFDIGKGVKAGESATMEWDQSTNSENCKQKVKAVYDDKSESEPASFDFCEADLELDF